MSLQIRTREHDSNRPGVRIGAVQVEGEQVCAEFYFGGAFRATREQAERQARLFIAAMESDAEGAAVESDFMKGLA